MIVRNSNSCLGRLFSTFGLIAVGLVMLFFGRVTSLQCTHPELSEAVCVKRLKIMGLLPVGEETTLYVKGAQVAESCDDDGCTFRVELITGRGYEPLTSFYSSGRSAKRNIAAKINAYVATGGGETLEVADRSGILIGVFGIVFLAVGLLFTASAIGSFAGLRR